MDPIGSSWSTLRSVGRMVCRSTTGQGRYTGPMPRRTESRWLMLMDLEGPFCWMRNCLMCLESVCWVSYIALWYVFYVWKICFILLKVVLVCLGRFFYVEEVWSMLKNFEVWEMCWRSLKLMCVEEVWSIFKEVEVYWRSFKYVEEVSTILKKFQVFWKSFEYLEEVWRSF